MTYEFIPHINNSGKDGKKNLGWGFISPPNAVGGFTIIELVLVAGIIAIIAALSFAFLSGSRNKQNINSATQQITSLLRNAQSRSIDQSSSTYWGVHFENSTTTAPFYALFFSGTYGTSTTIGYYRLPAGLSYDTSTLASGASKEITFSQLSGLASASTSIKIYATSMSSLSSTISIASSGAISY